MDRNSLLRHVEFKPDELKEALQEALQEVKKLERQKNNLEEVIGVLTWLVRVREGEVHAPKEAMSLERSPESTNHRFGGMKLADAAASILEERGGAGRKLHGRKILDGIIEGGLKGSMGTLAVAMRRDERFEKVRRVQNTWRLRQQPTS